MSLPKIEKGKQMLDQPVKKFLALIILGGILISSHPTWAAGETWYTLYKNPEKFGILVFPREFIFPELKEFVLSQGFNEVESGIAVMRSGSKKLNATLMMPEETQNKHRMVRFTTLQILKDQGMMVGIFDPEWGLTLPHKIFLMDEVKKRIPETLEAFRKEVPKKEVFWRPAPALQEK